MIRHSLAKEGKRNPHLKNHTKKYRKRSNSEFFADALEAAGELQGYLAIGLVGHRDLPGVAVRHAQAVLRWDLRPSLWSHAFIVVGEAHGDAGGRELREVTLNPRGTAFPDPATNGVVTGTIADYDDPRIDANVALFHVPLRQDDEVNELAAIHDRAVDNPNLDRTRYDLWRSLGVWQSFFWSAGDAANPLREGFPEPSSSFVEYCYEAIRLDLSPGASERNSAPEHLWNSAVWWYEEFNALERPVSGSYVLRDPQCTLMDPDELREVERGVQPGAG